MSEHKKKGSKVPRTRQEQGKRPGFDSAQYAETVRDLQAAQQSPQLH